MRALRSSRATSTTSTKRCSHVPQHLPDPRNQAFTAAAALEIVELLELSQGRAFVLFTSYAQMRLIYDRVSLEIPIKPSSKAPPHAAPYSRNSARLRTLFSSPRPLSGKAWTYPATS